MAPTVHIRDLEPDYPGFWGPPTSTLDWCEANYDVSFYIAEFWNTISNVFMIIPPICGAYLAIKDGLEWRIAACHLALMVVGLGSSAFHGTLLYEMQLMDEIPMIWGTAMLLYCLMEVNGKPNSHNLTLAVSLFFYCLITTMVYLIINKPLFHQTAYGFLVVSSILYSLKIIRTLEHSKILFIAAFLFYVIGFIIWNLDQIYCDELRLLRNELPSFLRPLLQGHAWWHIGAGVGTYSGLLFGAHARLKYLRRPVKVSVRMGWLPFASWKYCR